MHTLQGENEAIHSAVFVDSNRILAGGIDKKILGEFLEYHFTTKDQLNIMLPLYGIYKIKRFYKLTQHENDLGTLYDVSSNGR